MSDESIEEKQNYLRQNILDRGYDGNAFANFLVEKRGEDGADISSWSLNDLKNVVDEFIALSEQQNNENNNAEQNENHIEEQHEEKNEEQQEEKKEGKKEAEVNDWVDVDSKNVKNESASLSVSKNKSDKSEKDINGYGIKDIKEIECQTIPNTEIKNCKKIQIKVGKNEKEEAKLF